MATVAYALKRGRELGKTVILNPAPASRAVARQWYASVDYLIPNESEAAGTERCDSRLSGQCQSGCHATD